MDIVLILKRKSLMRKIAFCLVVVILLQIFLSIAVNFNSVYAYVEDGVEYQCIDSMKKLYCAILYKDIQKVVIKEKLSNGGLVIAYQIRGAEFADIDFRNMKKLKELTIPVSLINKDSTKNVFNDATSIEKLELTSLGERGTTELVNMPDFTDLINLKNVVIGKNITKIGIGVFKKLPKLETVNGTNDIKEIESGAFLGSSNLKKVYDFNGVEKIGDYAFYQCTSLEGYISFYNVIQIGQGAFENCKNFPAFVKSPNLRKLGVDAFKNSGIIEFNLSRNKTNSSVIEFALSGVLLKEIPSGAFYGCSELNYVTLSDLITKIGDQAFYKCSKLFSMTFPKNLEVIGKEAFYKCNTYENPNTIDWIRTWEIPTSVKSIGVSAFEGCNKINLKVPKSITDIGTNAFYGITNGTVTRTNTGIGNGLASATPKISANIDLTPPTVTWKQLENKDSNKERIEITVKDNDVGVKYYKLTYSSNEKDGTYTQITPTKSKTTTWSISTNKTVYFYAKDANSNLTKITIESNKIDINQPKIVSYKMVKEGSNRYLQFTMKDNSAGDSGLKTYGLSTDSTGKNVTYYNYSSAEAKEEVTKKIKVNSKGLYFLYIKDNVGHVSKIGPIWELYYNF